MTEPTETPPAILQGSPEWHRLRVGKVTASRISAVMAEGRSGQPSATRATYMGELIAERLSGVQEEGFASKAMDFGKKFEADARTAYCFYRNVDLVQVPFVDHPRIAMSGCSPDALVGDDGLAEFKVPNTATHIKYLRDPQKLITEYRFQGFWQMACTGRAWVDLTSYDPRLPEHMRLLVVRLARDPAEIVRIEAAVRTFISELDATIADLSARFPAPVQEAA